MSCRDAIQCICHGLGNYHSYGPCDISFVVCIVIHVSAKYGYVQTTAAHHTCLGGSREGLLPCKSTPSPPSLQVASLSATPLLSMPTPACSCCAAGLLTAHNPPSKAAHCSSDWPHNAPAAAASLEPQAPSCPSCTWPGELVRPEVRCIPRLCLYDAV